MDIVASSALGVVEAVEVEALSVFLLSAEEAMLRVAASLHAQMVPNLYFDFGFHCQWDFCCNWNVSQGWRGFQGLDRRH